MFYYTIRPIAGLLDSTTREEFTYKELVQLEIEINQAYSRQKINSVCHKHYRAIITELKDHSTSRKKKITRDHITNIVNNYLLRHELYYITNRHAPAHDENSFHMAHPEVVEINDLAFYHPAAPKESQGHHTINHSIIDTEDPEEVLALVKKHIDTSKKSPAAQLKYTMKLLKEHALQTVELPSQFYLRHEKFDQTWLIGNMQIDPSIPGGKWDDPAAQTLLETNNNKCKIMIQTALAEGITRGITRFIFHGGYANDIAQWGDTENFNARELITKKNLKRYQEQYSALEAHYNKIAPGDIINWRRNRGQDKSAVVLSKSPQALKCGYDPACWLIPVIYNLGTHYGFREGIDERALKADFSKEINIEKMLHFHAKEGQTKRFVKRMVFCEKEIDTTKFFRALFRDKNWASKSSMLKLAQLSHREFYKDLALAFIQEDAPAALFALNKIFDYVVPVDFEQQKAEKIKFLEELNTTIAGKYSELNSNHSVTLFEIVQPFLIHFNYHKLLMEKFPELNSIVASDGNSRFWFGTSSPHVAPPAPISTPENK